MLKIKKGKKIIFFSVLIVFLFFVVLDVLQYREFINVANAGGVCIRQDGGIVGMVTETCTYEYPTGPCSCALFLNSVDTMAAAVAGMCETHKQVSVTGQKGTTVYAIPTTFMNIKGGGTTIKAGDQFLYCGITNMMPMVWGAPGSGAKRIQKILDMFDYAIAGFKK